MDTNTQFLKVYLPFNTSTTEDLCGNSWTAINNPTTSANNAIVGNALQLTGGAYLQSNEKILIGGQDFTVDFWAYGNANQVSWAGLFAFAGNYNSETDSLLFARNQSGSDLRFWFNQSRAGDSVINVTYTGIRHHYAIVYHHSALQVKIYVDGTLTTTVNLSAGYERLERVVYIGRTAWGASQYFQGIIDEFRIYDGVALWTENFTPPTTRDYVIQAGSVAVNITVDVARKVKNPPLMWKYENYGTADLLSSSGTTLTNLPESQSKTGSAFYQTARAKCFDIPATPEIWIRFDVFTTLSNRWRAYNGSSNGSTGICSQTDGQFDFWVNSTQVQTFASAIKNQLQTVILHMVTGSSGGIVEAWLDGVKIYTYTGNVNNGDDFADIYLQSDGSGTFFSNVIISNGEIQLYEGWHSFSVDVQRDTSRVIEFTADVVRTLKASGDTFFFDAVRSVFAPYVVQSDGGNFYQKFFTGGDVFEPYNWGGNSLEVLPFSEQQIQFPETGEVWLRCFLLSEGAYLLKIFAGDDGNESGVAVDRYTTETSVMLAGRAEYIDMYEFDGLTFGDEDDYHGHYLIHLKSGVSDGSVEIWYADQFFAKYPESSAVVKIAEKTGNVNNGQPLNKIRITLEQSINCPDEYKAQGYNEAYADALRYIVVSNTEIDMYGNSPSVSLQFTCDVVRNVGCRAEFFCDVLRKIPHRVIVGETDGVQSIQIELAAQQLTDRITYVSVNPADIMEQIRGQFLDYSFDMRVEEITQNGALYTCQLCSDIDQLLYTQFNYSVAPNYHIIYRADTKNRRLEQMNTGWTASETKDTEIRKATAKYHLYHFGDVLNIKKQGVIRFDDFVSDLDVEQKNVTYADLISNLFGWTARLPQMMIHCYFCGDKIYVIQRGHEDNEIDITNLKHTAPTVNRKIMRTTWGSSPDEEYSLEKINPGLFLRPPPPEVSEDGKTSYTYKRIDPHGYLLTGTRTKNDDGSVVEVTYSYTISAPYNLTEEHSVTRDSSGKITDKHTVQHNHLTPSQTHSVWYEDGNNEGSVIGSHVAGFYDEVITLRETTTDTKTVMIPGNPLIDTSFPVVNQDKLAELSAAIRWLNRKTQETISMDIYNYPHIIDFNDRIIFNGNTYFLDSNSVTRTPRIVNKQSITIVRWY